MRKTELYGKTYAYALSNILDDYKISEIEFKLEINDCTDAKDIENYLCRLEEEKKLYPHYIKYETHKDCWLFYFQDTLGNKYYLSVSKE